MSLVRYSEVFDGAIRCPCGGDHLHHQTIEVFTRDGEDAPQGTVVMVRHHQASVRRDSMTDCPSGRRSGIRIRFECESCDQKRALVLVQHKGHTLVEWE